MGKHAVRDRQRPGERERAIKLAADPEHWRKEFMSGIKALSHRHRKWQVFQDVCLMAMYSLHNAMMFNEKFEAAYLDIVKRYDKEEVDALVTLFSNIVISLEANQEQDFLGSVFMELELGSHWGGQYFTPYHVAKLMAQMTAQEGAVATIKQKGYLSIHEPAAGSGVMVIAALAPIRDAGARLHDQVYVEAWDIDLTAVAMCYIQLSLLGVAARVVHGNTLSMEVFEVYRTPMFALYNWEHRLKTKITARDRVRK